MPSAPDATSPSAAPHGAGRESDAQAILAIVRAYESGWNAHDPEALAALFADDIQWVNIVGMWWRGRTEVHAAHIGIHATMFKDVAMRIDDCGVRFLTDDVAVSVVTLAMGGFTPPDGKYRPPSQDRLMLTMRCDRGKWCIVHGHNTPIDAEAQRFAPLIARPSR
ncbi:MAG: SgcJ/EcaC family oxidoreductase [Steroidobacteraceae bacterium]